MQFVQVAATCTRLAVQVVTCTEFNHQIISTCTTVLYKLDFKRTLVKLTILYIYIIFLLSLDFHELWRSMRSISVIA